MLASTMGVVVTEQVGYSRPAEKVDQVQIPGRAGMLTLATGSSWETVTYVPVCALKPGADREKVFAWLRGSGEVVFGSMPGFGFEARLMNQIDFRQVFEAVGAYGTFSPVFSCQPLRHQVPQEGKIVCTNGMKLTNPGNVASRPKIAVFCTGSVTLSLAGQAVHLTGQTGGSVLDVVSVLREAGAEVLGIASIFTYGMQKGLTRLAEANVKNVSLTNFDVIAAVAAEQNYIKQEDVVRLIQFRNNPADESWIGGNN